MYLRHFGKIRTIFICAILHFPRKGTRPRARQKPLLRRNPHASTALRWPQLKQSWSRGGGRRDPEARFEDGGTVRTCKMIAMCLLGVCNNPHGWAKWRREPAQCTRHKGKARGSKRDLKTRQTRRHTKLQRKGGTAPGAPPHNREFRETWAREPRGKYIFFEPRARIYLSPKQIKKDEKKGGN